MSYGDPKWRPWVLDEQAAMPFFRKAVEAGIDFFDTADVWKLYDHPADIEVMRACQAVAARRGVEPAQVAIAWLLAQPAVTAPIIGATKIEHLEACWQQSI